MKKLDEKFDWSRIYRVEDEDVDGEETDNDDDNDGA